MSINTYLFSYGSLQEIEVQLKLYGRKLIGVKDSLQGYQISDEKVAALYPILIKATEKNSSVIGLVFQISAKELVVSDDYEGHEYHRIAITLTSGKKAWCYVKPQ
ncbi:gamma-glutamylcyclotransferase family protein [Cellulophaga baltica]|uniref:gamma-glutamylcyclotransferase family protein n=1 Tax=Cellulophaga baltica TaxID=76594 RepID=UPI0024943F81|nr:gamma-glutamylcyclotransferase [Cellulophaga baltica]